MTHQQARKGTVISSGTSKGGPGKTTTIVHLTYCGQDLGLSTCLIDMDPQGNASDDLGDYAEAVGPNFPYLRAVDLFKPDAVHGKPVFRNKAGIALIPADDELLAVERLPFAALDHYKRNIDALRAMFDLIGIDTPPTKGFAMLGPMTAADAVFSPIKPDKYGPKGVKSVFTSIQDIRSKHNPKLRFLGVLINQWDRRSSRQNAIVEQFQAKLGDNLFPETICLRAAIADAPFARKPVWRGARSGAAREAGKEMKNAMLAVLARAGIDRQTETQA